MKKIINGIQLVELKIIVVKIQEIKDGEVKDGMMLVLPLTTQEP